MRTVRQKLGSVLRRISEFARLPFYTRPQTYQVKYTAYLKNQVQQAKDAWLVMPVPPETDYQHLLEEPVFDMSDVELKTEEKYGNRYAVVKINCAGGQDVAVTQTFRIRVSPRMTTRTDVKTLDVMDNAHCHPHDPKLKAWAGDWTEPDQMSTLERLNALVVERLSYGNPIDGLYTDKQALDLKEVDCGGFSTLMLALAGSVGIPGRLLCGFWAGHAQNDMHAWSEYATSGGVVPADASIENLAKAGRTRKAGRLGYLGSDRIVFSRGCDYTISINGQDHQIDILQHPVVIQETSGPELVARAEVTTRIL
jgi:hypothetical protein